MSGVLKMLCHFSGSGVIFRIQIKLLNILFSNEFIKIPLCNFQFNRVISKQILNVMFFVY